VSYFRNLVQSRMSPVLDENFGEVVWIRFMHTKPNFPPSPDPARPPVEAVAVFQWRSAFTGGRTPDDRDVRRVPWHAGDKSAPEIATRVPQFSFSAPCAPVLKRGDRIKRCVDGTEFEVTAVLPDGAARILVQVVQLGVANAGNQ